MFALNNLSKNRIVNGRLFIYEQDTTDLADVFTYEGSEFVPASNPIYCVDGVPNNTYFLKNKIYDVVAQEYVGSSSDPAGDLRPEMWVETFSTKVGFELDKETNSNTHLTVNGIANLKDCPVGDDLYVDVIGYWTDNDCERRTYYWDSTCVNIPDQGLIIESNVSDSGRWILICNEVMKSEYYGVYGNTHQENLNELFKYNDEYGSMSLVSPKTIMLAPGAYGDGYSILSAGGKHIIFSYGAKINTGNILRCMSFEGTDTLGNIQIGFNKQNQYSVAYTCNQTARLSNYRTVSEFVNSNAQCLIFDVEANPGNPQGQPKLIITATKTLTNVRCIFEKFTSFWCHAGNNFNIIFDNCQIESNANIGDNACMRFKNCEIKDSWFKEPWQITYVPSIETGLTILPNNFAYADSYFRYLTYSGASAITADCYNMKFQNGFSFGKDLDLTIRGLNSYRNINLGVGANGKTTLIDCNLHRASIYSPDLTMKNCSLASGYLTADGNGGKIYRTFDNCTFGTTVDFTLENATAVNLKVFDCDFGQNNNVFQSTYGLDIPTGGYGSYVMFRNNRGLNDGYPPVINLANPISASSPSSVADNLLIFTDCEGIDNWKEGLVTYELYPWINDLNGISPDSKMNNYQLQTGPMVKEYNCDFARWADGRVHRPDAVQISAKFPSYVAHGQWYNPFETQVLIDGAHEIKIFKYER